MVYSSSINLLRVCLQNCAISKDFEHIACMSEKENNVSMYSLNQCLVDSNHHSLTIPSKHHIPTPNIPNGPDINIKDINRTTCVATLVTASLIEATAVYPVDLANTRIQVDVRTRGFVESLRNAYHQGGIRGLYQGFGVQCVGSLFTDVTYFFSLEYSKSWLDQQMKERGYRTDGNGGARFVRDFSAGFFAELMANTFIVPTDLIVSRLQIQGEFSEGLKYKGGFDAIRKIYAQKGVRGFYQGYFGSLAYLCVESGILWAFYGQIRLFFEPYVRPTSSDNFNVALAYFLSGCISGMIAATISNPIRLATTRIQTQDFLHTFRGSHPNNVKYTNFARAIIEIYKTEGFLHGIMKGSIARVFYAIPMGGALTLLYEKVKELSWDPEVTDEF